MRLALVMLGGMVLLGAGVFLGGYVQRLVHDGEYAVLEAEVEAIRAEVNQEPMCETFLIMKPDIFRGQTYTGVVELCGRDQYWTGNYEPEPELNLDDSV